MTDIEQFQVGGKSRWKTRFYTFLVILIVAILSFAAGWLARPPIGREVSVCPNVEGKELESIINSINGDSICKYRMLNKTAWKSGGELIVRRAAQITINDLLGG